MHAADFERMVNRHRDLVYRVAYSYMRNPADADDVAQDVFVKFFQTDKRFESDEHARNWLVRVTINQCKSLFRRPWRRAADIEAYADALEAPDERTLTLFSELMQLSEKYRVPLVLYYYVGFSTQEVADALRIPPATARTRIARGRAKLRSIIETQDEDGFAAEDSAKPRTDPTPRRPWKTGSSGTRSDIGNPMQENATNRPASHAFGGAQ